KVVFREYEEDFRQAKTHPSSLGLLGPTLRGQEGETIVVTFRNMADRPYSIHPHGIAYGKQSEGAHYFDNTSLKEKEDDVVQPNCEHTYHWEVTSDVSPGMDDPTCLTHIYMSHENTVQDYNSGLIGTLLICKPGSLDELGEQVHFHQESVFLFGVFDEKNSWYQPKGHATDNHVKYTINGYTRGSLPGHFPFSAPDVSLCAHTSVSLHLMGMSSDAEMFSVHMNGQVLQHDGHKVSSVGLVSGSTATAIMTAMYPGRWLLSSQTTKHLEAGMHGFVDVRKCEGFEEPRRRMTIKERRYSKHWTFFIAAEEVIWDYAPNMPSYIDEDYELQYLKQGPNRIGRKYKKVVYTQYTNESFTVRAEEKQRKNEIGILGPVIRAQIRDVITIVFKNMASRPYSIYPHGLTMEKSQEEVLFSVFPGNQSRGVQPGETHVYEWTVTEEDEPLEGDARCLTRVYHSAVDTPRDIASGLIGPLLICKSQSLNVRNVQLKADKEQHAMFSVFDENKSWYLDYNIRSYCDRSRVNRADQEFYKSNVMHTINGYVFESGQILGFCNGEVVTWHMSSIGAQDYIQTDLINKPVVIGVPRPDFSDYELYVPGNEPDHLGLDAPEPDVTQDEYEYVMYKDPYSSQEDVKSFTPDETTKHYLKMAGQNFRTYFISAEEVEWDYAGYGQKRQEKSLQSRRETKFTKVIFRGYLDSTFSVPDIRGEVEEHLGILGPLIKAEVGQSIMVVFRNNANRPFSLHPKGVSYTKLAEGLAYEDDSKYWYKYDDEVKPNTSFTYLWKVNAKVGPAAGESDCRTWAYYSGVNPERDIHTGLIGPLLVCRKGTMNNKQTDMREFTLLFMTFDESQSWYYEKNRERMERKNRRTVIDPNFKENLNLQIMMHAYTINGIVYSLKGLRMYTNQLVRWHLINMGSPQDFQSVHFHGQTFLYKHTKSYRQAVHPLLPGGFATLEMLPSKPGLWQLETEVSLNQQRGMQTLFLALDNGMAQ
uniref:Coagulation factor V n=1 Tax=Myripristis murdjan TaxID=586833 RepID=A0A668AU80_9TELE